jgi:uncharacterized iron-regulated membrane protein
LRLAFTLMHRWVGLTIAAFLFVSGLTGAIISWDHELDELLNAHLTEARTEGAPIPPLDLAKRFEQENPQARVTYVPLATESGHSISLFVSPRIDPETKHEFELGYNQVFFDPATGEELGRREWGAVWPITRETFVSFLYVLHYSLHIPEMWGIDSWGLWLMGGIAILWMLDCFVGFYLTLPARREARAGRPAAVERQLARGWWARWKPAWRIKRTGSPYRINFDIHRAFSLWTWGLLFMLAFTAFSLNLYREIFYPIMSVISEVTPGPFETRTPRGHHDLIEPKLDYAEILTKAQAEKERRGWTEPIGDVFYDEHFGVFTVRFFHPGDDHGAAGVGPAALYFDGEDGRYLGNLEPWRGTVADIFVQAQFPLHSGRILGMPGRIIVSILGIVVAALSVTGVVIWWKKRAARVGRRAKAERRKASRRGYDISRAQAQETTK